MAFLRNFGHDGYKKFKGIGINGKNSEFHAAMGLSILPHLSEILSKRKSQSETYLQLLKGLIVSFPSISDIEAYNFAYFPIIFPSESALLQSKEVLETHGIFPRRYFYPGLNTLDYTSGSFPVSDSISCRILCLPLYFTLSKEEQKMISRLLLRVQNNVG